MPKTRVEFWADKFVTNVDRDARSAAALRILGWRVAVVWECETRRRDFPGHLAKLLESAT